ncbi:MAG: SnoaL-like domain-containing protein [Chloroflexi bacterium]|nr:SnoaL-like domain-containing protein [Chloroflexota bacterium]
MQRYLQALGDGDAAAILELFVPDGVVFSPLYGEVSAAHFYRDLFADTSRSTITPYHVFHSLQPERGAVHFRYDWVLRDGTPVTFECVDVFEFDLAVNKVKSLTIIYDTSRVRPAFNALRSSGSAA